MSKKVKMWKQKDGTKIKISDMSDSHLLNCIHMIERICKKVHNSEMKACMSISFQGEIAQMEQDNFISNSSWEDYAPNSYNDLVNEAIKRGLNP